MSQPNSIAIHSCRSRALLLAMATALAGVAGPAHADAAAQPAAEQAPAAIEEVLVTAQKREEHLQDVPISMAVLGEATLKDAKVDSMLDVTRLVPNFYAQKPLQSAGMRLLVRGIGAVGNTGIDPSVATFLDGAYVPRAGSLFSRMYDIKALEVLRGPQGTLFGRNASAGAVQILTNEPGQDFGGSASVEGGAYGYWQVVGVCPDGQTEGPN
jgi:iron complex outermembrane receptor protein